MRRQVTEYIVLTLHGWYGALGTSGNFRHAAPFATKLGAFRFAATIPNATVWTRTGDTVRQASAPKR